MSDVCNHGDYIGIEFMIATGLNEILDDPLNNFLL
jgi:hypothetical protein